MARLAVAADTDVDNQRWWPDDAMKRDSTQVCRASDLTLPDFQYLQ